MKYLCIQKRVSVPDETWTGYLPKVNYKYWENKFTVELDVPPIAGGKIPFNCGGKETCWRIISVDENTVYVE